MEEMSSEFGLRRSCAEVQSAGLDESFNESFLHDAVASEAKGPIYSPQNSSPRSRYRLVPRVCIADGTSVGHGGSHSVDRYEDER